MIYGENARRQDGKIFIPDFLSIERYGSPPLYGGWQDSKA